MTTIDFEYDDDGKRVPDYVVDLHFDEVPVGLDATRVKYLLQGAILKSYGGDITLDARVREGGDNTPEVKDVDGSSVKDKPKSVHTPYYITCQLRGATINELHGKAEELVDKVCPGLPDDDPLEFVFRDVQIICDGDEVYLQGQLNVSVSLEHILMDDEEDAPEPTPRTTPEY